MLKMVLMLTVLITLVTTAYYRAEYQVNRRSDLHFLKLGMSAKEIKKVFGVPTVEDRNQMTYILEDSSELTLSFRDKVVTSAKVKYRRPLAAHDPELRKLTLVQMDSTAESNQPSWFFAGKPEEGLIYKISDKGLIESLTWVQPFTYSHHRPKNLQALLRDFNSHRTF